MEHTEELVQLIENEINNIEQHLIGKGVITKEQIDFIQVELAKKLEAVISDQFENLAEIKEK